MVVAVTELEQATRRDRPRAAGGGAIQAHGGQGRGRDAQDVPIECARVCSSGVIVTEVLQDIRQAVVGQVGGTQSGWQDGVQGGWRLLGSEPHTKADGQLATGCGTAR